MSTTRYIVDNQSGQTINGELIKPYKVYTALVTQSGSPSNEGLNSGELTIGVTYTINSYAEGDDFTNVGAPSNNNGVSFVATGTTPNSWNGGTTLVYNTGAPVVTVLENTLGDVWFTFLGNGTYGINNTNGWDVAKVWYGIPGIGDIAPINVNPGRTTMSFDGLNFMIVCYNNDYTSTINNQLINTPIEIRVYD